MTKHFFLIFFKVLNCFFFTKKCQKSTWSQAPPEHSCRLPVASSPAPPSGQRPSENKFLCQMKRGCEIFTRPTMSRLHIFDVWPSSSSSWKVKVLDKAKVMVQLFFHLGWFRSLRCRKAILYHRSSPCQRWLARVKCNCNRSTEVEEKCASWMMSSS